MTRKGTSLVETMIAIAIFAMLIAIIVGLVSILIASTDEEMQADSRETEAAAFIYQILTDMKSASEVVTENSKMYIYVGDAVHVYALDDRTGVIRRDDEILLTGYDICELIPIDSTEVGLHFGMTPENEVEMILRCGAVEELFVDDTEEAMPDDE